jgi:hypothetical protein
MVFGVPWVPLVRCAVVCVTMLCSSWEKQGKIRIQGLDQEACPPCREQYHSEEEALSILAT